MKKIKSQLAMQKTLETLLSITGNLNWVLLSATLLTARILNLVKQKQILNIWELQSAPIATTPPRRF